MSLSSLHVRLTASSTDVTPSFGFDILTELLREDISPVGCIVMSGKNCTLYTVRGTEIIQHLNIAVSLPNKQGRGGQSAVRFERLGEEARHNYISKVIEAVIRIYPRSIPLIIGGPAYLKDKMAERLSEITTAPTVARVVTVQYDKKQGLYEMLSQCGELVMSLRTLEERKWIAAFMDSIAKGDNLSVYGNKHIGYCLENGLIRTLIVHEDFVTEEMIAVCKARNTELVILTDFLPEANQIKLEFGGKVGLLRYAVQMPEDEEVSNSNGSGPAYLKGKVVNDCDDYL